MAPSPRSYLALLCLLALSPLVGVGQVALERDTEWPWRFTRAGVEQTLAGLGGLNSPQPSLADLDGDGIRELYLFDREGDVHLALRRVDDQALAGWRYDPTLTAGWPEVISFAALRDFDADGVPDLFAFSGATGQSALEVYRGSRATGTLSFERVTFPDAPADVLYTVDGAPVYVAITDVPAIEDVDGDGDLDILSVEPAGSYVRFYENVGVATGGPAEALRFRLASDCYGGVYESNFDGSVVLASGPGACAQPSDGLTGPRHGGLHPGSTLGLADVDGDGDEDLLVGDIAADNIVALYNQPASDGGAYFERVESDWPAALGAPSVNLAFFPTVYPLPLAGPVEEYLVSPSTPGGGADYEALWRYTASATNPLQLDRRDYLTREALDHGTGAHGALGDLTGDGIDDLLLGNDQRYNGGEPVSSLTFYAFDAAAGAYVEGDPAWLTTLNTLIASSIQRPTPLLFDVDDDGDVDLLVGSAAGSISFVENLSAPGAAARFAPAVVQWAGIDVGSFSAPAMADLSGDGLPDLLVGDRAGRLNYYPNRGSRTSPAFDSEPVETSYGQIDVRLPGFPSPNLQPALTEIDGRQLLYLGTAEGRLLVYEDLPTEAGGTAAFVVELDLAVGDDLDPAFGIDPEGNPLVVVGNARGGIGLFRPRGTSSTTTATATREADWLVVPNPSTGTFELRGLDRHEEVRITDLLGRSVFRGGVAEAPESLPAGTYVLRARSDIRVLVVY